MKTEHDSRRVADSEPDDRPTGVVAHAKYLEATMGCIVVAEENGLIER